MGINLLILILSFSLNSIGKPKSTISNPRAPSEIVTVASWKIKAPDDQNFSLHEDLHGGRLTKALTFSIGNKDQRTFPVEKAVWDKWRTRLVRVMASAAVGKRCGHPLQFEINKKGSSDKSKSVCLDEITESERIEIQKLVTEWNEYLYGK